MNFLWHRILQSVVVICVSSVVIFGVFRLAPGDPAENYAGPEANEETIAAVTERFGLDESLVSQYWTWVEGVVQGDLGTSYRSRLPVSEVLSAALLPTLELAFVSLVLALIIGVTVGIVSARWRDKVPDRIAQVFNALALGIPNFGLGLGLVLLFSVQLGWLRSGGRVPFSDSPTEWAKSMILPSITLSLSLAATFARFLRSSMIEASTSDFVRTPVALGVGSKRVLYSYTIRNALLPLVTIVGIEFGRLMGGAIVVEAVFGWPGIGRTLLGAMNQSDYLVAQGALLWIILVFVLVSLLVDATYTMLDPRIRLSRPDS